MSRMLFSNATWMMQAMLVAVIAVPFLAVDAQTVSVGQQTYTSGQTITVSGSGLNPGEAVIQILDSTSTLKHIEIEGIGSDGSLSAQIVTSEDKWKLEGTYTVRIFVGSATYETTFELVRPADESESNDDPKPAGDDETPGSRPQQPETQQPAPSEAGQKQPETEQPVSQRPPASEEPAPIQDGPKTRIPNFPALDRAPQYYIDRYDNEPEYRAWFDSQFPGDSISDIVGYPPTRVSDFPALDRAPQYYIDRYDNEPEYRAWFDSQFPGETVYGILGFPDPAGIPDWIRENARLWSAGDRGDDGLVMEIQYMVDNRILAGAGQESYQIPGWFKNNVSWWSDGQISDREFTETIQYMIDAGII